MNPILVVVLFGVTRNFLGWVGKALKDGKIKKYEIKRLINTTLTVAALSLLAYLGFQTTPVEAGAIGTLLDWAESRFGKK